MAKHNNPTISEDALRILNTKTGDNLDPELQKLTPVIPIERITTFSSSTSRSLTGAGALFTTSANKDTYVTGLMMSLTSDVTADNTSYTVRFFINGVSYVVGQINKQTTTAGDHYIFIHFPKPLKIDRGTAGLHESSFTAGAVTFTTTIHGYEVETTR